MTCAHAARFVIFLVVVAIVAYLIVRFAFGVGDPQDIQDTVMDLFRKEDPFSGLNETSAWPNNGQGLDLTILNALTEDWYPYFNTAIQQWDSGSPDSLTLTTELRQPDSECIPETGYLKVCNGDYGETSWKGINKILLDGANLIVSSTALMNEYYLPSSNDNDRQYTMCHELGHGFGLPHTDENFYNFNQGNCLDYTINPGRNKQPDTENFLLLAKVYGEVNNNSGVSNGVVSQEASTTSGYNYGETTSKALTDPTTSSGRGDGLRRRRRNNEYNGRNTITREWIVSASKKIDDFIFQNQTEKHETIRRQLIHKSQFGEVHSFDIGKGYSIQLHMIRQI